MVMIKKHTTILILLRSCWFADASTNHCPGRSEVASKVDQNYQNRPTGPDKCRRFLGFLPVSSRRLPSLIQQDNCASNVRPQVESRTLKPLGQYCSVEILYNFNIFIYIVSRYIVRYNSNVSVFSFHFIMIHYIIIHNIGIFSK